MPQIIKTEKMAECKQTLVICAPLCFVFSKLNRLDNAKIKSVLSDFFSLDDLCDAKRRLISDAELIRADNLPRFSNRRDSDGRLRLVKEVDDILSLSITLDEKKLLSELPRYVVDNTDCIPTMKIEDGDLKLIVKKMEKMEESLTHLRACINMLHNTGETRSTVTDTAGVTNFTNIAACNSSITQHDSLALPAIRNVNVKGIHSRDDNGPKFGSGSGSWAERAAHEPAVVLSDMETDNAGEFIEVINSRRKKRRIQNSPQSFSNANTNNNHRPLEKKEIIRIYVNRSSSAAVDQGQLFALQPNHFWIRRSSALTMWILH